ncbi:MAG: hypothetical protein ABIV39_07505, partial [Verrucomicrobiota bacterium]
MQESEYSRLLGYPRHHAVGERPRELARWARDWYAENGHPWIFAKAAGELGIAGGKVFIQGAEFVSDRLSEQLGNANAHDAILVAVSAGKECEEKARRCWEEGKPDEYFFLEMYGSAVVEHLVTKAAARICAWADQCRMAVLPHYSPGYSGWPVSDQPKLHGLIRGCKGDPFPSELHVMETGMLRPKKSLLTVFGVTRHRERFQSGSRLIPCENCSLPGCQFRRAPYRYFMPQPEDLSRPQNELASARGPIAPVLDPMTRYSINARALKKWSHERLQLSESSDGSIKAHFRYEGTTCSNLGRSIEYDYHVRLESRAKAFRI